MICTHCKSTEFNEAKLKLKNGQILTIFYCAECGKIMPHKELREMPKVRKSWAERQAIATRREELKLTHLSWEDRKARKARKAIKIIAPNVVSTTQSLTQSTPKSINDDGAVPF